MIAPFLVVVGVRDEPGASWVVDFGERTAGCSGSGGPNYARCVG